MDRKKEGVTSVEFPIITPNNEHHSILAHMRRALKYNGAIIAATFAISGCVSQVAICEGSRAALARHAAALAETPDDAVALTGADLVSLIDAACSG